MDNDSGFCAWVVEGLVLLSFCALLTGAVIVAGAVVYTVTSGVPL